VIGLPQHLVGTKWLGWGLFTGAVLLCIATAPALFPSSPSTFGTAASLATAAEGPVWEEGLSAVERLRLSPGQPLVNALLEAEVSPGDAGSVLAPFVEAVDVRRLRPSDTFWLYRSRHGDVTRLEYERSGSRERVVVARTEAGFCASVEAKPVERYLRKLEGTVGDNLYLAIERGGGDATVVMNFSDLFAWDFDFFTDTREGDRFALLVEEEVVDGERAGFGRILAARYAPVQAEEPLQAFHYVWSEGQETGYYRADSESIRRFFLKSPLNYRRISSAFTTSRFHPILKKYRPHLGIDYAAPSGTPVVALGNGKVLFAGTKGGYGRTVQVRHNQTYMTQYAHLLRYGKGVRSGVRVKQGQVIGYVGSSGLSTGPHLDFRVQKDGRWMNPLHLKGGRSEPLPRAQRESFDRHVARLDLLMQRLPVGLAVRLEAGEDQGLVQALARLDTPSTS
jgi:murein DD-endopeptidase MepM/ murein hydrolase activator NlpD